MMTLEQLAYKLEPAGHEEQRPTRKYSEPDQRLKEAFEKWLKNNYTHDMSDPRWYDEALKLTAKLDCDLDAAHGLLYAYQDHPKIFMAGAFISTLYNKIPDKEIVYDLQLPVPIIELGIWLSKDKIIVNKSTTVCHNFGICAMGTIINCGNATSLGSKSCGYVINLGSTGGLAPRSKGPVLNDGKKGNWAWDNGKGLYINFLDTTGYEIPALMMDINGKCIGDHLHAGTDLYEYLTPIQAELQKIKTDHTRARAFVEALPPEKLKADILNIMKRYHHV